MPVPIIDPQPVEQIADSIIRIDAGMKQILASGLNERALYLLLADASGVNYSQCRQVIKGLAELRTRFVSPKKGSSAKS